LVGVVVGDLVGVTVGAEVGLIEGVVGSGVLSLSSMSCRIVSGFVARRDPRRTALSTDANTNNNNRQPKEIHDFLLFCIIIFDRLDLAQGLL
jgi:hypothetical protein